MINKKCIVDGCERKHNGRGLCVNHFNVSNVRVANGKTTWEKLEEQGLALPKMTQKEKNLNQSHKHNKY